MKKLTARLMRRKVVKQSIVMLSVWALLGLNATANDANAGKQRKASVVRTSQGDNNGKPFRELNQLITENRNLIEANQHAISGLTSDISTINMRIAAIEVDLGAVSAQVETNMADIGEAFLQLSQARGNIQTLQSDLGALVNRYQADMQTLEATLTLINAKLVGLAEESAALAAALNAKVAELRSEIGNNAIGIDALLVDISLINAELTGINANYNLLSSRQDTLSTQMDDYSQQLLNLEIALSELKSGANTPASDPCVESISVGQTISGELVNGGLCSSDSRSGGAQYYTFTISAPMSLVIEMDGSQCSYGGSLYDPYLYLHSGGRDGSIIAYNDDSSRSCGWTRNSRIEATLQPGTYTIEAASYSGQYGTFSLSLQ